MTCKFSLKRTALTIFFRCGPYTEVLKRCNDAHQTFKKEQTILITIAEKLTYHIRDNLTPKIDVFDEICLQISKKEAILGKIY